MNKQSIFNQISAQLKDAQEKAVEDRDTAQTEANLHIGRMESRYDTFKQEAQYEVEAQELRISKYKDGISQIRALLEDASNMNSSPKIQIGSIVKLASESGEEKSYILSPAGGGIVVKEESLSIFTLTPESPLGKQLLGLKIGDECNLHTNESKTHWIVKEIL